MHSGHMLLVKDGMNDEMNPSNSGIQGSSTLEVKVVLRHRFIVTWATNAKWFPKRLRTRL